MKINVIIKTLFILFLSFFFIFFLIKPTKKNNDYIPIPNPPNKIYPIQDYAGILSNYQKNILNKKLIYSNKLEILIPIIQKNRYQYDDLNNLAQEWGEKWKIGKSKKNNGIIILISLQDKKISIQSGYGVEPYVTDSKAHKIIEGIKPLLKKKMYYKAIDKCINEINKNVKDFEKVKTKNNIKNKNFIFFIIFFMIIIIILFILFFGKKINIYHFPFWMDIFFIENIFFNNFFELEKENQKDNRDVIIDNEDYIDFDGFGNGGHFGGGGSSDSWE